jgi:hypothetical protein
MGIFKINCNEWEMLLVDETKIQNGQVKMLDGDSKNFF